MHDSWQELIKAFDTGLINEIVLPEFDYRVYYDETGFIFLTTAVKSEARDDIPYIKVTEEQFKNIFRYKVINGELVEVKSNIGTNPQLTKSDKGFKVIKNNPALLLEDDPTQLDIEYYDYRNN